LTGLSAGGKVEAMTPAEPFADLAPGAPPVRGMLHRAEPAAGGIVLAHGAGSSAQAPLLVALSTALAASGMTALRCDLPFRQRRATGPPGRGDATVDRAGLRRAVEAVHRAVPGPLSLGGHSYGGRQASMLAAEDASVASALLLLSYPLHPPTRPDQPRTAHFPSLATPALFVHGTRDPFGTIEEIEAARALIPARTALLAVDGAGHDLFHVRRPGARGAELIARIVRELFAFALAG
jgi:uncharacterized protein